MSAIGTDSSSGEFDLWGSMSNEENPVGKPDKRK
jgi:hypothetical protein